VLHCNTEKPGLAPGFSVQKPTIFGLFFTLKPISDLVAGSLLSKVRFLPAES